MNYKLSKNSYVSPKHKGIVLLFTLVLLVVLATMAYMLTTKVRAQRSRDQYMIDYQSARYACDSAVKYADAVLNELKVKLVSRPNEPDFSDLFSLTDQEYQELIDIWEMDINYDDANDSNNFDNNELDFSSLMPMMGLGDANDINDVNGIYDINDPNYQDQFRDSNFSDKFSDFDSDVNEPNQITIRGPYGPQWPYVTEPVELEIGNAKVNVEIIDENAKYPIGWVLIQEDKFQREALAGFEGFCEWMDINSMETEQLLFELDEIAEIKDFQIGFKSTEEAVKPSDPNDTEKNETTSKRSKRRRSVRRNTKKAKEPKKKNISATTHMADFARMFNSPLLDISVLRRDTQISDYRDETALKYISLWPVVKVNINTAPRHVLEAAFVFGGDSVEIAEEIIVQRRQKVFKDIKELKKTLFEYSNSIAKCEKFITTESDFFTVRITAVAGAAKVVSLVAVKKVGKRFEVIAVISG